MYIEQKGIDKILPATSNFVIGMLARGSYFSLATSSKKSACRVSLFSDVCMHCVLRCQITTDKLSKPFFSWCPASALRRKKSENAALFLRLDLPRTLNRHWNVAFKKRSANAVNGGICKRWLFVSVRTETFWTHDDMTLILRFPSPSFSSNTNPN